MDDYLQNEHAASGEDPSPMLRPPREKSPGEDGGSDNHNDGPVPLLADHGHPERGKGPPAGKPGRGGMTALVGHHFEHGRDDVKAGAR